MNYHFKKNKPRALLTAGLAAALLFCGACESAPTVPAATATPAQTAQPTPTMKPVQTAIPVPTVHPMVSATPPPEPLWPESFTADAGSGWPYVMGDAANANALTMTEQARGEFATVRDLYGVNALAGVNNVRDLSMFYTGMTVFIALDAQGREGVYLIDGFGDPVLAYLPENGVRLAGVSGSKYALYWAEYDASGAWRALLLRFDEGAGPELLCYGLNAAFPPVFKDGRMLLTEEADGVYKSRLLIIDMAHDYPFYHMPPRWMELPYKLAKHDFSVNDNVVSLMYESENGTALFSYDDWPGSMLIKDRVPVAAHHVPTDTGSVWLDESGNLYLYVRTGGTACLVASDVAWYYTRGYDVFFADKGGQRMCVAYPDWDSFEGSEDMAPNVWEVAQLWEERPGIVYRMAAYDYYETLVLSLVYTQEGKDKMIRLHIGNAGE